MTADTDPAVPPRVQARPLEDSDRSYVYATAQNATISLHGGPFAHRGIIFAAVSAILEASTVRVASFDDDSDRVVLGFVAFSSSGAVEFLYLRQSTIPRRGWDENVWGLGHRLRAEPFTDAEMRVSDEVVQALLGGLRSFTALRPIHPRILEAVVHAGYSPRVAPRAI